MESKLVIIRTILREKHYVLGRPSDRSSSVSHGTKQSMIISDYTFIPCRAYLDPALTRAEPWMKRLMIYLKSKIVVMAMLLRTIKGTAAAVILNNVSY